MRETPISAFTPDVKPTALASVSRTFEPAVQAYSGKEGTSDRLTFYNRAK